MKWCTTKHLLSRNCPSFSLRGLLPSIPTHHKLHTTKHIAWSITLLTLVPCTPANPLWPSAFGRQHLWRYPV